MNTAGPDQSAPDVTESRAWLRTYGVVLVAAGVLIAMRWHAFGLPLETDECNYAYIAQRLLAGDRLYVDVWDHQPFGVFAMLAGVIAVCGDAPIVFRLLAVGFSLGSLGLIWVLARRGGGMWAANIAAILFALVSADPGTAGEGCNREIYMNTLILAAWVSLDAGRQRSRRGVALAGGFLALASALKTIVAVHWLVLAVWLVTSESTRRGWRRALLLLVVFGLPPLALWLATAGYFALTDRWTEWVDATFLFNVSYAAGDGTFWTRFGQFFDPPRQRALFDSSMPLWILAGLAACGLLVETVARRHTRVVPALLLALAGYLAIVLPAHFWRHYYYLMIPSLVLIVGIGVAGCARLRYGGALATLVALAPVAAAQYRHYVRQPLFGITVQRYNSRDFWGRALGEKVRSVTAPGDTVFVYGNEAEVYYYAQRRCASRYTMISGLAAGRDGVAQRRKRLLEDLEKNKPRVIILLFDEPPFPEWKTFLATHYSQPVGADFDDRTRKAIMYVLTDPQNPIATIDWDWDRSEVGGWFADERR
jgi:hypothetical protein